MRLTLLKILTCVLRFWLKAKGVRLGKGGWIHGYPQVRLKRGSQVEIGNDVTLISLARFNPLSPARRTSLITNTPEARIRIGDGTGISSSVISCFTSITIGKNTLIGAECLIIDSDFHGLPLGESKPVKSVPVEIGDHVFIGARSIILKGVKIGNKAIVGAGSVVSAEVPENAVVAGNPAQIVRSPATKS